MSEYREGDYIETDEGLLFHVKGLLHPSEKVIAFLRYVPSKSGYREREGVKYRKIYALGERYDYLKENYPKYITYSEKMQREMQMVPLENIGRVYKPEKRLEEIRNKSKLSFIEKAVAEFSEKIISEAGISPKKLGITGSILVDLHSPDSDIDLIGYGENEGWRIYSAMKELRKRDEKIHPYGEKGASRIAEFRGGETGVSLDKMTKIEMRKILHGLFDDRDFFIRLIKDWSDLDSNYDDFSYSPKGETEIEGIISNDAQSIFTPNHYLLKDTKTLSGASIDINKITSYRGRFSEQASEGDKIKARGKVEEVTHKNKTYHRILLGNPNDYLIPLETRD